MFVGAFRLSHGNAGSAHCVSLCPLPSPDSSAGLSNATIALPLGGTPHCKTVVVAVADENAARIPSEDSGASAAGGLVWPPDRIVDLRPGV
jgi:hypothetical protein